MTVSETHRCSPLTPAADGATEGLITVAPLKVTGATGSPINPILVT